MNVPKPVKEEPIPARHVQAEWAIVFVKLSQWSVMPRFARRGPEFQFQWLFLYVHRVIA